MIFGFIFLLTGLVLILFGLSKTMEWDAEGLLYNYWGASPK